MTRTSQTYLTPLRLRRAIDGLVPPLCERQCTRGRALNKFYAWGKEFVECFYVLSRSVLSCLLRRLLRGDGGGVEWRSEHFEMGGSRRESTAYAFPVHPKEGCGMNGRDEIADEQEGRAKVERGVVQVNRPEAVCAQRRVVLGPPRQPLCNRSHAWLPA